MLPLSLRYFLILAIACSFLQQFVKCSQFWPGWQEDVTCGDICKMLVEGDITDTALACPRDEAHEVAIFQMVAHKGDICPGAGILDGVFCFLKVRFRLIDAVVTIPPS